LLLDFTKKSSLIGGTGYTGEMKRNFLHWISSYLFSKHIAYALQRQWVKRRYQYLFGSSGMENTLSADPSNWLVTTNTDGPMKIPFSTLKEVATPK
jgi:ATP-dependent phosphoenolpyruvate carboxykinase